MTHCGSLPLRGTNSTVANSATTVYNSKHVSYLTKIANRESDLAANRAVWVPALIRLTCILLVNLVVFAAHFVVSTGLDVWMISSFLLWVLLCSCFFSTGRGDESCGWGERLSMASHEPISQLACSTQGPGQSIQARSITAQPHSDRCPPLHL